METRETTVQLIESVGLEAEEHTVETDDGYVLTLHRIVAQGGGLRSPKKKVSFENSIPSPRPVVFLQHGLLGASSDWCIGARDKALSFLLADAGYDVWLGNFRGNTYSMQHKVLRPAQIEFWLFSFDQMGQQDLPAMLSHVLNLTGQKQLTYIGHSMGTMAFWIMMNARPWMNASVKLMVGLAPIAAVTLHPASPLHVFVPFTEKVYSLITGSPLASGFTKDIYLKIAPQADLKLLPVVMRHFPAGTSNHNLVHFGQGVRSGRTARFLPFSFPTRHQNWEVYGAEEPKEYSLKEVTCPVVLYWGEGDWLSQPRGAAPVAAQLPNLVDSVRVPHDNWNHLDFLWGRDADRLLYAPVLKVIATFERVMLDCGQCQEEQCQ